MSKTGDYYSVSLKEAHIDWGRHRYTHTRERIAGEGYVPIPKRIAEMYDIQKGDCFTATFTDGFPSFTARAAGNSAAGEIWAKQFQGDGDLKAFGRWYAHCGAQVGDTVRVIFTSANSILFELVRD